MAKRSGWWNLVIVNNLELDDADLEHIADLIKEGYTSGEACGSEDEENEDDDE